MCAQEALAMGWAFIELEHYLINSTIMYYNCYASIHMFINQKLILFK